MTDYSKLVKCPAPASINGGLSACRSNTLLSIYGRPGPLGNDCGPVTSAKLKPHIITASVGPFNLTGHKVFLDLLTKMFKEVLETDSELYDQIKTAGCLCCRSIRGIPDTPSNHSFGTAVDVFFGERNDVVGDGRCELGLLALYPYAHPLGLYWGAEFGKNNPKREDSMHWEISDELAHKLLR